MTTCARTIFLNKISGNDSTIMFHLKNVKSFENIITFKVDTYSYNFNENETYFVKFKMKRSILNY